MRMRYFFYLLLICSTPVLAWQTFEGSVKTKYGFLKYEVHYKEENKEFAKLVRTIMDEKSKQVIEYFQYIPDNPVHYVINDDSESANGSATVFPTNIVRLNDFPPSQKQFLANSTNWRETLVIHELTHILTIGQVRGFLKGLSYVFGSIINGFAGIVPRWYAEGIAVWAESKFLPHGRLKNSRMIAVTKNKLEDENYCINISCLDTPPSYPYGSYAYWAGALFINHIENKKPGTIRCLLNVDSYSIPFFLNDAFNSCVGSDANTAFLNFRNEFLKGKRNQKSEKIDWQKGISIGEEYAFWIEGDNRGLYIKKLNFQTKTSEMIELDELYSEFSYRPWDLRTGKQVGPNIIKLWNGEHISLDSNEKLELRANYNFSINEKNQIGLVYENSDWMVKTKKENEETKEVFKIKDKIDLYNPRLFVGSSKPFILFHERSLTNSEIKLSSYELGSKSRVVIGAIPSGFSYMDSCLQSGKQVNFYHSQNRIYKLTIDRDKEVKGVVYSSSLPILDFYFSHNYSVLQLSNGKMKIIPANCDRIEKKYIQKKIWRKINANLKLKAPLPISEPQVEMEERFYPGFRHFRPHYWLFNYSSINNFPAWNISTNLSDPAGTHQLGLDATFYTDASKTARNAIYSFSKSKFRFSVGTGNDYSRNSISEEIQKSSVHTVTMGLGYKHWGGQVYATDADTSDFISGRKYQRYGIWQNIQYTRNWDRFFFRNASLLAGNYYQKTKNREKFWGHEFKLTSSFNFFNRFDLDIQGTYGKISNNRLSSGVLYGGANNETLFGGSRIHEFYGLAFGDLFGREIWTSRIQGSLLISEPYDGFGMIPFFMKRIYLTAGVDTAKSDFSFIGTDLFVNKKIVSYFAGMSVDSKLFYLMPARVSLLATNVHEGSEKDEMQFLFLVRSALNFL